MDFVEIIEKTYVDGTTFVEMFHTLRGYGVRLADDEGNAFPVACFYKTIEQAKEYYNKCI